MKKAEVKIGGKYYANVSGIPDQKSRHRYAANSAYKTLPKIAKVEQWGLVIGGKRRPLNRGASPSQRFKSEQIGTKGVEMIRE